MVVKVTPGTGGTSEVSGYDESVLPTPVELERVLLDAVDRQPDSEVIERPGWAQVRCVSSPRANHNVVVIAALAPGEVDSVVAEVDRAHGARGSKYRWIIGPSSGPAQIEAALVARGLELSGEALGMAMMVPEVPPALGVEGLTMEPLGPGNVDLYASVTTRAWEKGAEFEDAVRFIADKAVRATDRPTRSFIARLRGEPVATSHLRLLPEVGYMQGGAVLRGYRRRGIYGALLHHRLAVLREHGLDTAVIWADRTTSAPVCARHGFSEVTRARFFEVPMRRPGVRKDITRA
jgi:GNAT superfamily N-acetyltransferase